MDIVFPVFEDDIKLYVTTLAEKLHYMIKNYTFSRNYY